MLIHSIKLSITLTWQSVLKVFLLVKPLKKSYFDKSNLSLLWKRILSTYFKLSMARHIHAHILYTNYQTRNRIHYTLFYFSDWFHWFPNLNKLLKAFTKFSVAELVLFGRNLYKNTGDMLTLQCICMYMIWQDSYSLLSTQQLSTCIFTGACALWFN